MIFNYFKTAWRTLVKNKTTSVINMLGLSIGISASLIIFMVVQYDFSFDKFEPNKDRIFRMVTDGKGWQNQGVPVPFYTAMAGVSGIEQVVPLFSYNDRTKIKTQPESGDAKLFNVQKDIVFTNAGYFTLFPHTWLAGNAKEALAGPYKVVLSESRAKRYFPGINLFDVVGRTLILNDTINTTVTGVVKDLAVNSDFENKVFVSVATAATGNLKQYFNWDEWGNTNSSNQVMIKLLPGTKVAQVDQQIAALFNGFRQAEDKETLHRLQPLSDIHFNTNYGGAADLKALRNLVLIAIFLLLLGTINFINLSTAHASERAKEIGIRKTLGGKKGNIVLQFLSETFLLTLCTAILSVLFTPLLLGAFEGFIPEGLKFDYFLNQPVLWLLLLALVIVVSILAGLYPALILTRFKPVSVLKNSMLAGGETRNAMLRKTLIVFQFVIAQVFVIGVLVVNKQIRFSMEKDMGFRKDAIVNFYVPFDFFNPNNKKFVLKEEVAKIPGVQNVSVGNQSPAFNGSMSTKISYRKKGKDVDLSVDSRNGDTSFLGVYNIRLLAGRNIMASDTANELLVNETLMKQLGFNRPDEAIGQFVKFGSSQMPIAGVMADFNLTSVRTPIHPLIYYAAPKFGYVMHIALQPDKTSWNPTLQKIKKAWTQVYPEEDFEYTFLDENIAKFYQQDRQLSNLLTWSSSVAVLISCLGLFGLVIFMTNKRTKEIGVRKVLGASVRQIVTLLSVDFVKLLLLSFVIAIPIAWWQAHSWLQNFAYHTALSWWIFLMSGVIMIVTSVMILLFRAGKAAMANPVNSLRSE